MSLYEHTRPALAVDRMVDNDRVNATVAAMVATLSRQGTMLDWNSLSITTQRAQGAPQTHIHAVVAKKEAL